MTAVCKVILWLLYQVGKPVNLGRIYQQSPSCSLLPFIHEGSAPTFSFWPFSPGVCRNLQCPAPPPSLSSLWLSVFMAGRLSRLWEAMCSHDTRGAPWTSCHHRRTLASQLTDLIGWSDHLPPPLPGARAPESICRWEFTCNFHQAWSWNQAVNIGGWNRVKIDSSLSKRTFNSHLMSRVRGTQPRTFMSSILKLCEKCYWGNTHLNFHG